MDKNIMATVFRREAEASKLSLFVVSPGGEQKTARRHEHVEHRFC
jgi:hypothetical protein